MKIKLIYNCIDVPDYFQGSSNLVLQIPAFNGQTLAYFKSEMERIINGSTFDELVLCKIPTEKLVNDFVQTYFPDVNDFEILVDGLFETDDYDSYYHYVDVVKQNENP